MTTARERRQAIAGELMGLAGPGTLERRIVLLRELLGLVDRDLWPAQWAEARLRLGQALLERHEDDLDWDPQEALAALRAAAEVFVPEAFPRESLETRIATGVARMRCGYRQGPAHFTAAAVAFAEALGPEAGPRDRALAHTNLCEAYRLRPDGDGASNVERALGHGLEAVRLWQAQAAPGPEALALLNVGAALLDRRLSDRQSNLGLAREHLERALALVEAGHAPNVRARAHLGLGAVLASTLDPETRRESLTRAAHHLGQALAGLTAARQPRDWGMAHLNLAVVLSERRLPLEAIPHAEQAQQVFSLERCPAEWARTHDLLAQLWTEREDAPPHERRARAETHYGAALAGYTRQAYPAERRATLQRLGALHFAASRWPQAHEALAEALAISDALWERASTAAGHEEELAATPRLHARAAFCLLRLDRPSEALAVLERGRTRLLRRRPALDVPEILALAPAGGALVVPVVTSAGGAVFVLPHGAREIRGEDVVPLDGLTERDVEALLGGAGGEGGWINGYFGLRNEGSVEAWQAVVEDVTATLWTSLMDRVHARLRALGLASGAPVVLMPQGGLALLPLHAAWRWEGGVRAYFLDDFAVAYAPSACALAVAGARVHGRAPVGAAGVLVVCDPEGTLAFARSECAAIRAAAPGEDVHVLEGAQATRAEVLKHAAAREYLHFACHGQYHWSNVELSGLFLADGLLTLDELAGAELDLTALRLVTLSACETGVAQIFRRVSGNVFTTAADEYIGLSTGLLRTGAPAVLCSLWPVDDYATSLLMGAFYQRHLGEALSIGRALREAQRWVRGLRLDELRQRLAAELESLERRRAAGAADAADERQAEELRIWLEELEVAPAGEPPLSHPYYWAGFNAVGAVLEGPPRRRPV